MSSVVETPIAAAFQSPTQPHRKSSQTTTLCCSPTSLNKKSFTSVESSSRRSSSTPLADRFMNSNNSSSPIKAAATFSQEITREVLSVTPDYGQNDQQLFSPPCATIPSSPSSPPPLYFLSYDPSSTKSEFRQRQYQYCRSPPKRKRRHHSSPSTTKLSSCCCCDSITCSKQKYNAKNCRSRHHHCRHEPKRKNRMVDVHQKPYILKDKTPSKKRHEIITIKIDNVPEGSAIVSEKREKHRKSTDNRKDGSRIVCCCFIRKWKEEDHKSLRASHKSRCFCYCGRREWVMFAFITLIVAFILAFVFWPRTPLIRIEGAIRTGSTKVLTQTQQGSERMMMGNVAFESVWLLNITMDNRRNYLPSTRFNRIQIFAKDAMTGLLIGKGIQNDDGRVDLPGHTISTVQLPISINYQARDKSDTTFLNLLRACTNMTLQQQDKQHHHHPLPIQFWFTLYIFGLDWLGYKPSLIATPATGGFICPL